MDQAGTGVTAEAPRPRVEQTVSDYRLEQVEKAVEKLTDAVSTRLDGLDARYVPQIIYNGDKVVNTDRHIRNEADIAALQTEQVERDKFARGVRVQGAFVAVSAVLSVIGLIIAVVGR